MAYHQCTVVVNAANLTLMQWPKRVMISGHIRLKMTKLTLIAAIRDRNRYILQCREIHYY